MFRIRTYCLVTDNSGQSITKTTIVKDSKNVTIAHKAEVHHYHTPEKKKKRDNFKGRMKAENLDFQNKNESDKCALHFVKIIQEC